MRLDVSRESRCISQVYEGQIAVYPKFEEVKMVVIEEASPGKPVSQSSDSRNKAVWSDTSSLRMEYEGK